MEELVSFMSYITMCLITCMSICNTYIHYRAEFKCIQYFDALHSVFVYVFMCCRAVQCTFTEGVDAYQSMLSPSPSG